MWIDTHKIIHIAIHVKLHDEPLFAEAVCSFQNSF